MTEVHDFKAEMQAILDKAQAERRNITPEEEQRYLLLARLAKVAYELEQIGKESDLDD